MWARQASQAENAWLLMPLETVKDWLRFVENTLEEDDTAACSMVPTPEVLSRPEPHLSRELTC